MREKGALGAWELRRFSPPFNHPPFAVDQLHFTQAGQIVDVTFVLRSTKLQRGALVQGSDLLLKQRQEVDRVKDHIR